MRTWFFVLCLLACLSTADAQQPCPNGNSQPQVQGEYHPITRIARRGYRRVGRVWYGLFSPIHLNDGNK